MRNRYLLMGVLTLVAAIGNSTGGEMAGHEAPKPQFPTLAMLETSLSVGDPELGKLLRLIREDAIKLLTSQDTKGDMRARLQDAIGRISPELRVVCAASLIRDVEYNNDTVQAALASILLKSDLGIDDLPELFAIINHPLKDRTVVQQRNYLDAGSIRLRVATLISSILGVGLTDHSSVHPKIALDEPNRWSCAMAIEALKSKKNDQRSKILLRVQMSLRGNHVAPQQ